MKYFYLSLIATTLIALSSFNYPDVTAKLLERKMVLVGDHLYASKFETTNAEYQLFLNHLKENSRSEELEMYRIFDENWVDVAPYQKDFYSSHPAFLDNPVVNITYEGAVNYCSWLTEMYNSDPKRKFSNVLFRLPSEEEWVKAAKAGNDKSIYPQKSIYPWGTPFLFDENGVFNCNYLKINESNLKIDINNPSSISIIGKPISRIVRPLQAAILAVIIILGFVGVRRTIALLNTPRAGLTASSRFVASTFQRGSLYLIPPDIDEFRLAARVPIWIDYKSIPYKDTELVEWFNRVEIATDFYASSGDKACSILKSTSDLYGITHVVRGSDSPIDNCGAVQKLYIDADFAIYEVQGRLRTQ